jgi:hypothetical protein
LLCAQTQNRCGLHTIVSPYKEDRLGVNSREKHEKAKKEEYPQERGIMRSCLPKGSR